MQLRRAAEPQPNTSYRSVSNGPLPLVATILLKKQAFTNLLCKGFRSQYFQASSTEDERRITNLEGWILGIL